MFIIFEPMFPEEKIGAHVLRNKVPADEVRPTVCESKVLHRNVIQSATVKMTRRRKSLQRRVIDSNKTT